MGARELKEAFNTVSIPRYTCTLATLGYDRRDGKEFQILKFSGMGADGNSFNVTSEPLEPNSDVVLAAGATAQALMDRGEDLT